MADRAQRGLSLRPDAAATPAAATAARAGLLALALLPAACGPSAEVGPVSPTPPRAGRFGSLRDFVLVALRTTPPAPVRRLFVDRFEVTRGDWAGFAETPAGAAVEADRAAMLGDPALPVGLVDLRQARAFAAWRFARLPTRDEWFAVALGKGRYDFPWGFKADATRANTAELGLFEPTLVGTFESGRRGPGQPYDLIGNVSEWTETVPPAWCQFDEPEDEDTPSLPSPFVDARRDALATLGIAVWQIAPGVVPAVAAVAARSDTVPREVMGADFQRTMVARVREPLGPGRHLSPGRLGELVFGGDRRLRTGLRVFSTPVELLRALVTADVTPTTADYEQLRRFVDRDGHASALRQAWPDAVRGVAAADLERPLAGWLRQRLGT